jgi:hypothetical protein
MVSTKSYAVVILTHPSSDVTLGLSHYHNRFDVVQARCITGGVSIHYINLV